MKYERFEDLPVWQAAIRFAVEAFTFVEDPAFNYRGDLRSQLQRSSLSISQNIAEGFERGTTAELLMFLYIARGSAGESRSALRFCALVPWLAHKRNEIPSLIDQSLSISRQLRGWAESLQNSDITGQRHLNDATRDEYQRRKRSAEFLEKLQQMSARNTSKPPVAGDSEI